MLKTKSKSMSNTSIEGIISMAGKMLAEGAYNVEIIATTMGAVSYCDISIQDEPAWLLEAQFEVPETEGETLLDRVNAEVVWDDEE